ncbi:molybdate ABC transporter substrate-binding protein [Aquimarina gracilis]|uniref:Molybdate ABC transporter substrate-binding protein n=1 Tax=Aquimarina gracilis TaxID=874422 RepID=A0ABU5ZZE6_9FLAO|nr:molybdate ABC transporter substrate-binding protein [Aquimarina gracilis]MEB3347237.1 molybdate ABC transporter substrate-binding protein [Aquimarina gracilis]
MNLFFKNLIGSVFLLSLILGCTTKNTSKVTIATASNMHIAMKEITMAFTKQTGIDCDVVVSSSGKLTAQIKEGAPYDVFVSADMKYPEALYKDGHTTEKPKIYGYGKLVLWSINEHIKPDIISLIDNSIEHIAVANPKTAPYGEAAISVLNNAYIYDKISDKLVFGESISQTNQFIVSGAAQVGFTAKSMVLSPQMKEKGQWIEIDQTLYTPIAQAAVIVKKDSTSIAAKKFYTFLFSEESKEILENFGYLAAIK